MQIFAVEKLASNLKINITKMWKTLKSEKFIIFFPKIWTESYLFVEVVRTPITFHQLTKAFQVAKE